MTDVAPSQFIEGYELTVLFYLKWEKNKISV